jgi:hypothetical protein
MARPMHPRPIGGPSAKRRKVCKPATAAAAANGSADGAAAAANGSDGTAVAFIPTVQCLGDIPTVQCLDGPMLVDNAHLAAMTSSSGDIPRVLFHLLQIRTGEFKAETSGSVDLRCYEIKRAHLSNIIAFVRCGVLPTKTNFAQSRFRGTIDPVKEMKQAFERLGGWDRFDSAYLKYQKEQKLKDDLFMENPQIPSQDTLGLFDWREPHVGNYTSSEGWSHTGRYTDSQTNGRKYWKRKRRDGNEGNFEVKYCQFIGLKNKIVGA